MCMTPITTLHQHFQNVPTSVQVQAGQHCAVPLGQPLTIPYLPDVKMHNELSTNETHNKTGHG